MGVTVCKILHCHCETHDEETSRAFEYYYETGVDPDHTYLCQACRQKVLAHAAKHADARDGDLPKDMVRTRGGSAMETHGRVTLKGPWQTVPKKIGADEEVPIDGAVSRPWGGKDDMVIVNQEGRA